jgi:hypothetical protein
LCIPPTLQPLSRADRPQSDRIGSADVIWQATLPVTIMWPPPQLTPLRGKGKLRKLQGLCSTEPSGDRTLYFNMGASKHRMTEGMVTRALRMGSIVWPRKRLRIVQTVSAETKRRHRLCSGLVQLKLLVVTFDTSRLLL